MKKLLCTILAAGVIVSNFIGCGSDTSQVDDKDYVVKLAVAGSLCEAPIQMAIENGYFEEEGVKVETVKIESAQAADSLQSHSSEALMGLISKMAQPLENGLEAKVVLGVHTGCTKILVGKDSDINSVADLKGKSIGVPGMASAPAILTQRVLANEGIGVTTSNLEVDFQVFNQNDLPLALENGSVQAIALSDPAGALAVNSGQARVLYDSAIDDFTKDEYCCGFFLSNDLIEKHPEVAAKVTRAIQKGCEFVNEDKNKAAKLQVDKQWVAGDAQVNGAILETYNYSPSVKGGKEALKKNLDDLQKVGLLQADTDVDALTENSFAELEGVQDK